MSPLYIVGGIAIMALMTYIIRVSPMVIFRQKIENNRIKSFLYYIPYTVLAAMTFPAILSSTASFVSGAAALVVGVILAYRGKSLIVVAVASSAAVLLTELLINLI
jgi:branched-subunit amino acid transport protein